MTENEPSCEAGASRVRFDERLRSSGPGVPWFVPVPDSSLAWEPARARRLPTGHSPGRRRSWSCLGARRPSHSPKACGASDRSRWPRACTCIRRGWLPSRRTRAGSARARTSRPGSTATWPRRVRGRDARVAWIIHRSAAPERCQTRVGPDHDAPEAPPVVSGSVDEPQRACGPQRKRRYPAPRRLNSFRSAATISAPRDSAVATSQASFSPIRLAARRCRRAHRRTWARCRPWIANRWRAANARVSSTAPSSTSSTVTIDTTRGRPPSVCRNLRAGPCSALAASRSSAIKKDASSSAGRLTRSSGPSRDRGPPMR